jgi:5-oxoprolinase (ATP-hydrolysing)
MWRFWIDTGGTFTDCLALDPEGDFHRAKVLSSSQIRVRVTAASRGKVTLGGAPEGRFEGLELCDLAGTGRYRVRSWNPRTSKAEIDSTDAPGIHDRWTLRSPEEAPLLGIRLILGLSLRDPLPPLRLFLATTKATNALLERRGDPVALVVSPGFRDLLEIGTQQRPDLFARRIVKPRPLTERVLEFGEPLPEPDGAVAISLLNAYRDPSGEDALAEELRGAGWTSVTAGTALSGRIGYLQRTRTAVAEAFLDRLMSNYFDRVEDAVGAGRLLIMSSRGALLSRALVRARDTLLSGPAGGLIGAAEVARRAGFERTLTFDMGGTSTDVARFDHRPGYRESLTVGEAELQVTTLRIETIAAGGGSICSFSQGALKVGPESAGSSPGPACYGGGGPLTLTDIHVFLGRLHQKSFGLPLDLTATDTAVGRLAEEAGFDKLEPLLAGLLDIANEKMAEALRRISVREGYDPREYVLTAFGGAGGWHACALADRLGMTRVVFPADAGLLSAFGLSVARREQLLEHQVLQPLDTCLDALPGWFGELESAARETLAGEGLEPASLHTEWARVSLRLLGQEATLEVDFAPGADLADTFAQAFRGLFGFFPRGKRIEVVLLRVLVAEKAADLSEETFDEETFEPDPTRHFSFSWMDNGRHSVPVYPRDELLDAYEVRGPAIIQDRFATIFLEPGWKARVGSAGTLLAERVYPPAADLAGAHRPEEVELELFTRRYTGIVEQMGALLRRTALSVNIRERLDFSCGLLDAGGGLVANAPHIPVHLGALGLCVRSVAAALDLGPGDMAVTNHPGHGGSHLPDITVIAPVHTAEGALLGYVANRAHHAELGGIRPGSMPPGARGLAEEGVVIPPTVIVRAGETDFTEIEALLRNGPYPTRALEDNLADLQAQVAANRLGAEALRELAAQSGAARVEEYFRKLSDQASRASRAVFAALPEGDRRAEQVLENGAALRVNLRRAGEGLRVDFTGTSPVTPDNFNAAPAIVRGALIYVLRVVSGEDIPLNEGFLREVDLILPECLLNPAFPADPAQCPAVVAGNVETSQRLVDTLLLALEAAAASQGTMNNTVFGNARFGYYETLCGGSGGCAEGPGASAVHCHMTNTAITDPEVLEARYPVRLRRFAIRPGSGGPGVQPGGNGVLREYEFLEPVELSLLTERRSSGPYGLSGGTPGEPGWQKVIRADGSEEALPPTAAVSLGVGDRLLVATPGGGGWGKISRPPSAISLNL